MLSKKMQNSTLSHVDSEEELVYYKMAEGGDRKYGGREEGIKKTTEYVVTERMESPVSESDKDVRDKRMKPWEHQPHAV